MKSIKCVGQRFIALFKGYEANQNEISLFDVKELYDAAYDEKARARASLKTFKALLDKAEMLDAAYRAQLQAERMRLYGKAA